MREDLKKANGKRKRFTGTFVRFGIKHNFRGLATRTVLITDIVCKKDPSIKCDHMWFNLTKEFYKANLKEGDTVQFEARVKPYWKGYRGYKEEDQEDHPIEKDYKLNYPKGVKVVKKRKPIKEMFFVNSAQAA